MVKQVPSQPDDTLDPPTTLETLVWVNGNDVKMNTAVFVVVHLKNRLRLSRVFFQPAAPSVHALVGRHGQVIDRQVVDLHTRSTQPACRDAYLRLGAKHPSLVVIS